MSLADRIDGLFAAFFPERALRRRAARMYLKRADDFERRFSSWDAAKHDRLRGGSWLASRLSIDGDLQQDLTTLRDRSRESVKNDPYAASYADTFVTNTVGREIRVQSRILPLEGDAVLTESNVRTWNTELEALWKRQSQRIGVDGESLHELQQLAMRHWAVDGEPILLFSSVSDPERPVPLAVQVVDPARMETPPDRTDGRVVLGVERNAQGRIVAYHFRKGVVGDPSRDQYRYDRIPAERVARVFDRWHADQSRGFPKLSASLGRLKDLRDHDEAILICEQVAAAYGVFVETGNPVATALANQTSRVTGPDGTPLQEIRPAGIHYHDRDTKITVANPSQVGGNAAMFSEGVLRAIAAGSNTPYELIAKDYSRTTYSSGRLSLIDGRLNYQLAQANFIRACLAPIWSLFVRQAVSLGLTSIDLRDFTMRPWAYDRGQWMPPGWPWIDPQKDVQASVEALDGNLTTLSDELAARGIDFEEWLERRKVEKAKLEEAGLDAPEPDPAAGDPANQDPAERAASRRDVRGLRHAIAELNERLEALGAAR